MRLVSMELESAEQQMHQTSEMQMLKEREIKNEKQGARRFAQEAQHEVDVEREKLAQAARRIATLTAERDHFEESEVHNQAYANKNVSTKHSSKQSLVDLNCICSNNDVSVRDPHSCVGTWFESRRVYQHESMAM